MYIFRDYPSYSCPDGGKSWSRGRGETGEKEGEEKKEGEGKEGDQGNNEYSAPESSKPYRVEGGRRPLGGGWSLPGLIREAATPNPTNKREWVQFRKGGENSSVVRFSDKTGCRQGRLLAQVSILPSQVIFTKFQF